MWGHSRLLRPHLGSHRFRQIGNRSSSAFSLGMVIAERVFRLSGVDPRRLQRTADSGRVNTRLVCPNCGSWVCGLPRDGVVRVRAGTLKDTSWLRPTRHVWTRSKQHWVMIPGWRRSLRHAGLTTDWPGTFHDRYQNALHELVRPRSRGSCSSSGRPPSHKIINLMEAR